MKFVRNSAVLSLTCWAFLAVSGAMLWAADVKVARPARVTVTKSDGTAVAGELTETSPAGLKIKASPKADAVLVPWSDVKQVSNGLTRSKVVAEWKVDKADRLCDTCHGDGTQKCDHCHGTGVEPATATDCTVCHGTGDLGKCPKCTAGKIPCPNQCLKASSFSGTRDGEGKLWRQFRGKSGTLRISDAHVGELVVMEKGDPVMKGKCPTCHGTTQVECPTCHGTAKKECPTCHGGGKVGPACAECKAGQVVCKTCDGSGLKPGT